MNLNEKCKAVLALSKHGRSAGDMTWPCRIIYRPEQDDFVIDTVGLNYPSTASATPEAAADKAIELLRRDIQERRQDIVKYLQDNDDILAKYPPSA